MLLPEKVPALNMLLEREELDTDTLPRKTLFVIIAEDEELTERSSQILFEMMILLEPEFTETSFR